MPLEVTQVGELCAEEKNGRLALQSMSQFDRLLHEALGLVEAAFEHRPHGERRRRACQALPISQILGQPESCFDITLGAVDVADLGESDASDACSALPRSPVTSASVAQRYSPQAERCATHVNPRRQPHSHGLFESWRCRHRIAHT
jgi:hypothetical protein